MSSAKMLALAAVLLCAAVASCDASAAAAQAPSRSLKAGGMSPVNRHVPC